MLRFLALVLTLGLALGSATTAQSLNPRQTIRIAMPPVDAASQAYYAQAKGFFAQVGLNAEIITSPGGAQVAAAVVGGSADIGQSNISSLCSAHERGLPFVAIAGANEFNVTTHQSALVVAPNAPFKSPKDLNGKTIGVAGIKNITEIAFDNWLDENGGDPNTARTVEIPFATMADAVASGRIDGAMMTTPELTDALAAKRVKAFDDPMGSIGKRYLVGVWFTTAAYAKAHPDVVRAFARAMALAGDWANHNQAESAKILATATGVPVAPGNARVLFATSLDPQMIQPVIDVSAKYGALKKTFPAAELTAQE